MPEGIFDFAFLGAALKLASGLKTTPPQNDPTAIHKAPEPAQDYSFMYWAGPGQRWVQDASGKWVTEDDDNFVRDAQGNVVLDYGFPMRKSAT